MTTHKTTYSSEEIESIYQQLRAIKIGGVPVFTVIKSQAVRTPYHVIYVDTGVSMPALEFRKAREEEMTS